MITLRKSFDEISQFFPFSMIAQVGLVLMHKLTGALVFLSWCFGVFGVFFNIFYPLSMVFNRPLRIVSLGGPKKAFKKFNENQFYENVINAFPGSEWIFFCLVNVRDFIKIADFL